MNTLSSVLAPVEDDMTVDCRFIGVSNNIIADPIFCNAGLDNFTIQTNSPAAPNDPSGCGLRGALPVGCGTGLCASDFLGTDQRQVPHGLRWRALRIR